MVRKQVFGLILVQFLGGQARAAFEHASEGAGLPGLGGSSAAWAGSWWTLPSNPSLLAFLPGPAVSFAHIPRPFEMRELGISSCALAVPTSWGSFGLAATRAGFDLYRETTGSLSWACAAQEILAFGLSVRVHHLAIRGYGSRSVPGLDAGVIARLAGGVRWGLVAFNLNAPELGSDPLPRVLKTGLAYSPWSGSHAAVELSKDISHALEVRLELQYQILEVLRLRGEICSAPDQMGGGAGLSLGWVVLDYCLMQHPDLGPTHGFALSLLLHAMP
ncbi:MAG: hypothetical protein WB626_05510 [Bacteroidota bacterium]